MNHVSQTGGQKLSGGFHVESGGIDFADVAAMASMPLSNGNGSRLIAGSTHFKYAQTITHLYEIGSNTVTHIGGPASGTADISRTTAKQSVQSSFCERFDASRTAVDNELKFQVLAGCGEKFRLHNAAITQVSATVAVSDLMCAEGVQLAFLRLENQ